MLAYQQLTITGGAPALEAYVASLTDSPPAGWWRDHATESRLLDPETEDPAPHYCFSCAATDTRPTAHVVLIHAPASCLSVSAIFPPTRERLEIAAYNGILLAFHDEVVAPGLAGHGLHIELTSSTPVPEDWMSSRAVARLRAFSAEGRRSAAHLSMLDQVRWQAFVIAAWRDRADATTEDLRLWLTEEGWRPDIALRLAEQYTFGYRLLRAFEDAPHRIS